MESGAYGAAKAGGAFDVVQFLQQPQIILRFVSWVFAIVVFACISAEGYQNDPHNPQLYCIFNKDIDTCHYGVGIGVLAFLACVAFMVLDVYFPQLSNVNDRKYIVLADVVFSGLWTFLWFVGFCLLTNRWVNTGEVTIGADAARAAIAFSFFSVFSWGLLTCFALKRYRMGVNDMVQNYADPSRDTASPYSTYPSMPADSYQQPPFTSNPEPPASDSYQPPVY
ncbi:synaptogyrin-2b [Latimeria chalumnae]|uniref:Synaptogyrin n=1 Tax=Latimeria chalumnae TaxID=7897 RepID=H3B8S3_LATCH|nr:PREDICTED: synaptogyrin-2 [Latimeria chalumnae]|eukprot:XP_005989141.1 PREDICTED: synaptogyrin-2 [Latimeria chalumnae]